MDVEEYVKKLIKVDGWRSPDFLVKRIMEKEGVSVEVARAILNRIVEEDRSLRFIYVQAKGRIGYEIITARGRNVQRKIVIAYHRRLDENPTPCSPISGGFYPKETIGSQKTP